MGILHQSRHCDSQDVRSRHQQASLPTHLLYFSCCRAVTTLGATHSVRYCVVRGGVLQCISYCYAYACSCLSLLGLPGWCVMMMPVSSSRRNRVAWCQQLVTANLPICRPVYMASARILGIVVLVNQKRGRFGTFVLVF